MGQPLTQPRISLEPITIDKANEIIDDEMLSRISQDGDQKELPRKYTYIGCNLDGKLIGFFALREESKSTIDLHINIKKIYRGYARIFSRLLLDNLFRSSNVNRVETEIPDLYKDVLKFAHSMGFKKEGVKREAFLKNNNWHDKIIVGLTRSDYGR